ncbi:zf-TFIIB domain-containing protein [Halomicroarcula sp. GCM10025709]|uniref:TFIIB-type zinc ribbon-containing protein n=1 Tax=Haloarcula TaxID=2237 RepID=UPI0024C27471|nr:zf-TFIIB domain-containing protein [Halomicroarcula sp. YJ-61-S]
MDCPRCGDPLESYRLGDSETAACGSCAYLGVPVDHKSEDRKRESWDDALDRFNGQQQTVKRVTEITDTDVFSTVTDDESESGPDTEADERADSDDDPSPERAATDDDSPDDETDRNREPASADAGD